MKIWHLIHHAIAHAYFTRASREIARNHPDVLHVELKRLEYRDKLRSVFAQ